MKNNNKEFKDAQVVKYLITYHFPLYFPLQTK